MPVVPWWPISILHFAVTKRCDSENPLTCAPSLRWIRVSVVTPTACSAWGVPHNAPGSGNTAVSQHAVLPLALICGQLTLIPPDNLTKLPNNNTSDFVEWHFRFSASTHVNKFFRPLFLLFIIGPVVKSSAGIECIDSRLNRNMLNYLIKKWKLEVFWSRTINFMKSIKKLQYLTIRVSSQGTMQGDTLPWPPLIPLISWAVFKKNCDLLPSEYHRVPWWDTRPWKYGSLWLCAVLCQKTPSIKWDSRVEWCFKRNVSA